jgi:chorismate dehydratase
MQPIRIGTVEYLNTVPLIAGMSGVAGVELVPAVPSRIGAMLASGEVDLGLVSMVDIVRADPSMVVLPAGMIGCDGPTMTVRIFSRVPLAEITTLHADTDSHTSVALARVLLDRLHGVKPEIRDFHARENPLDDSGGESPESVLLIGDKVVTGSPQAVRYPHSLDLGEAWHTLTGLPFVYAAWACLASRADEPAIREAAVLLDRTRRRNAMRPDQIVNDAAVSHRWPVGLAKEYVGALLRYDLGDREETAIGAFVDACIETGVMEPGTAIPEIRKFVTTPG